MSRIRASFVGLKLLVLGTGRPLPVIMINFPIHWLGWQKRSGISGFNVIGYKQLG